jgi:hypothetical protein
LFRVSKGRACGVAVVAIVKEAATAWHSLGSKLLYGPNGARDYELRRNIPACSFTAKRLVSPFLNSCLSTCNISMIEAIHVQGSLLMLLPLQPFMHLASLVSRKSLIVSRVGLAAVVIGITLLLFYFKLFL